MTKENIVTPLDFPMKCGKCKREIPDGAIYYEHPKHGNVCEYCPEFNDGGITIEEPKD